MSLGCDNLFTLKSTPSFTIFHSPHQIPIQAHHYPDITPHYLHYGPCYRLPVSGITMSLKLTVSCIIWWSSLLSRRGNGSPPDNICAFYHCLMGSISDVLRHPSPYLQAGVECCNWVIREQGGNSSGPWITPYRTFLAPATHTDALLAWKELYLFHHYKIMNVKRINHKGFLSLGASLCFPLCNTK